MTTNTFTAGLMVSGLADPARLVPTIVLSAAPMPSARRLAAIQLAQLVATRAPAIHHYQEASKCA